MKTAWQKKIVSILFAVVLAAVVVVFYQNITGLLIGNIWVFMLLAVVIVAASLPRYFHSRLASRSLF